jgi:hypothetical protein
VPKISPETSAVRLDSSPNIAPPTRSTRQATAMVQSEDEDHVSWRPSLRMARNKVEMMANNDDDNNNNNNTNNYLQMVSSCLDRVVPS